MKKVIVLPKCGRGSISIIDTNKFDKYTSKTHRLMIILINQNIIICI